MWSLSSLSVAATRFSSSWARVRGPRIGRTPFALTQAMATWPGLAPIPSAPTPATHSGSDAKDSNVVVVVVLEAVFQIGDGAAREVAGDDGGDDKSVGCLVDVGDGVVDERDARAPFANGGEAVVFSAFVFDSGVVSEQRSRRRCRAGRRGRSSGGSPARRRT